MEIGNGPERDTTCPPRGFLFIFGVEEVTEPGNGQKRKRSKEPGLHRTDHEVPE